MPIAKNFTSVYTHNWHINFLQCMPNGLLKYTDLCNMLQLTAGYHAEKGGLSFTDMQVYNQAWVLSRMRVEINELPVWRDEVTVKTWIYDLQGSRSVRALEMYCGDKKVAGSVTFWAVMNTQLRKPEPLALPHDHFKKFPEKEATAESFKRIELNRGVDTFKNHTVVFSDLDIVNHANNVKYLEWCLDSVPPELLLKSQLKSLDMNFMRELYLGDEVIIGSKEYDKQSFFSISKNSTPCFALELNRK